jgi:ribosomal protein S18 acetylase RimI-like enzyme
MSDHAIRAATIDDLQTIADFNTCLAEETEDASLVRETVVRGVQALLTDRTRGSYYVACDNDRMIGQIMHTREWSDWRNGDVWWIQSVYVHPDYRRRGVFRALHRHVKALAAVDPGVVGLRLYVEEDNHVAQMTYEGLGMNRARYVVMQDLFNERA